MKTVLFICSGNIFRSVTAQLALSREIGTLGLVDNFRAESAGTSTANAIMRFDLMRAWKNRGLVLGQHTPRQVSKELLDSASAVISMGCDHQEYLWEKFQCKSDLFNKIACGKDQPILDVGEIFENHEHESTASTKYIEDTVQYIVAATPKLFQKLRKILA